MLNQARASDQDVIADQYPYTAGSTTIVTLLPAWVLEGSNEKMLARLEDQPTLDHHRFDIKNPPDGGREFNPANILISFVPAGPNKKYEGLRLTAIAAQRGQSPRDVLLDLVRAELGGVQMIGFNIAEEDMLRVMRHQEVAVASDGWTLSPESGGKPHPRSYGTYARVLGKYVREDHVLGLKEAVRKMTLLPARRLGRSDMGLIRPGYAANLVVFDPLWVAERATFEEPHQYYQGVEHVLVNGQLVIESGEDTGAAAGRVLKRSR
jgi:N-acyl-D-amino-acid deacylase